MRRRDRTGGKVKARRHKALTLKAMRRRSSSPAGRETNVARLSRELSEAFEQQTATSEILNVISNSLNDTQPVFDAIVQSGLKLFPGALVSVALRYGDTINAAAVAAPDPARVEAWRRTISRTPLARNYMHGAALLDRRIVDIPDVADAPAEFVAGGQNFLTSGNRAITIMPMTRGDEAIGLLSVVRLVPGPLSDKQLAVLRTFRQPGRHRHREHAPAQRAAPAHRRSDRVAGAADGDVGNPASHQQFAQRHAAGVRRHRAERVEALSGRLVSVALRYGDTIERRGRRRAGSCSRRSVATHVFLIPVHASTCMAELFSIAGSWTFPT